MEISPTPRSGINAAKIRSTVSFENELYRAMRDYCIKNGHEKSWFVNECLRIGLDVKLGRKKLVQLRENVT